MRKFLLATVLAGGLLAGDALLAQTFVELKQDATPYNFQSAQGVPLSNTSGTPPGSDGRAPGPNPGPYGTPHQFSSATTDGAAIAPHATGLSVGASLFDNSERLRLPRGRVGAELRLVMTSARLGAPFMSRPTSFLFGSVISSPEIDEYGVLLSTVNTNVTPHRAVSTPDAYWVSEPFTTNNHSGAGYYWSANAGRVYAVSAGPIDIRWRKAVASLPQGTPANVSTSLLAGATYTILSRRYVVSTSPVKPVRQMYWTEGDFSTLGKRVLVPAARVGALKIVYNNTFPERVTNAFPQTTVIEPDPTQRLDETRTLWYDQTLGSIHAYNAEGRVFMEILGDLREDRVTRQHLGFEIVDVIREPTPSQVTTLLGDPLEPYARGQAPDQELLFPEPILNGSQSFTYQHTVQGSDLVRYYAARETRNLNDLQVHWLESGIAGLKWPKRFVRYAQIWPSDVTAYSHYVRPLVASESDARLTAVSLPNENAPFIQYQDALDQVRGKLTERFQYYSFLAPAYPAHRALLRFNAGEHVRFECIFSWLDEALRTGALSNSVATQLSVWNPTNSTLTITDALRSPRTYAAVARVGDRINPPPGEFGAGYNEPYLAGHIVTATGTSFHPAAYQDPFAVGFDAANRGAIVAVNAIPGNNLLEVNWFRRNQVEAESGFKPIYWPAVTARYTLEWPTDASEIVLASNRGSGPLLSLQAKGSVYYQNDRTLPGYNPNEEHALMQGGQAYALRDDLNVTSGSGFSSEPFVLLDYVAEDGRPMMRAFKVLREKPEAGIVFDYAIAAGTVLQPPMPLPLLEIPFAPKIPGRPRESLNQEFAQWTLSTSTNVSDLWTLHTSVRHFLHAHDPVALQNPDPVGAPVWFYPLHVDTQMLQGHVSHQSAYALSGYSGAQASNPNHWRYTVARTNGLVAGGRALVSIPSLSTNWLVDVASVDGVLGYVELTFATAPSATAKAATTLFLRESFGATGAYNGWRAAPEPLPVAVTNSALRNFYASFTLEDRKGNLWVYRGPHSPDAPALTTLQFYYRTLPGFHFPTLALDAQPPAGTITPYLRSRRADGTYVGDGVRGNADNDQVGDGNSHGIRYRPKWPENTPVLQMAETLTLPKRGLPAVRGQTSLEVVYQQSQVRGGDGSRAVTLHDPTREKAFALDDPASTVILGKIPDSVATTAYRGRTYFPKLPPHLVDRFFLDSNRGKFGALVFRGEFVDAPLGDRYLFLNVLGTADMAELKRLCLPEDQKKVLWDAAVDQLSTQMERFVEDPGKPGTYIASRVERSTVGPSQICEVFDEDVAVDSYAMSATGPGVGYVTLIAGNGHAFTPEAEPVSVQVIRVVDSLYRGEVNVVASSNPLNERLTLQQVVDLAGRADEYRYEWLIAAPVDGLPPHVYENTQVTLVGEGTWTHLPFPLATDVAANVHVAPTTRVIADVGTAVVPVSVIPFSAVSREGDRYAFQVEPPHRLSAGSPLVMVRQDGELIEGTVHGITGESLVVVEPTAGQNVPAGTADVIRLHEGLIEGVPQSVLSRQFDLPANRTYTQIWLSLNLGDSMGVRAYVDGQLAVVANLGTADTVPTTAPAGLTSLNKTYRLNPSILSGGTTLPTGGTRHHVVVELFSAGVAGGQQAFDLRLDAYESIDVTGSQWLPIDPVRYEDGVRAILGGNADVRSLSDNYVIMRYQAKSTNHASWKSDPSRPTSNIGWSQWTTPQLAEGWIKRVLAGLNPFNQRITDLFNNAVNTDVSILGQAGPRWEGDVALNLDSMNDFGLIEIYETVLNRGKMLSIRGGINYGPANDALLLAAGYLNDLYMMLGNEAWADAANPTIGIGTKDNQYGDIATALFSFKGQLPSLLEEELALLRGRDDFLLPGVELRPVYNRLIWNYTRGIDSGEVVYSINYDILDQNGDGTVDADDARRVFPQGHGDAYGHYLTALKGYYSLLTDPSFDWVPRIEAVTVLGKPVSVDYQDERKFAAAAAAVARTGAQIVDLTWRRDFQALSGQGWEHLAETKANTITRNLPVTRHWGVDHWAARTGQGAYVNWIIGNAILPDADDDPSHAGSIQQVDRTTVPELKELPAIAQALQTSVDNAAGGVLPLGIPANTVPFDLNPLQIGAGMDTSTHFEQVYARAKETLSNALLAFDDAKDVTRLMRSEQDSLVEYRVAVNEQERAFNANLIELYGSPYADDMGPGRTYAAGYAGPDTVHYMYIDNAELTFGGLLTPRTDYTWRIDVQTFTPTWLDSKGISDFSFITKARTSPVDGISDPVTPYLTNRSLYVEYNLSSHGFFKKPSQWTGRRAAPGRIQQAISDIVQARNAAYAAFYQADAAKYDLDWAIIELDRKKASRQKIRDWQTAMVALDQVLSTAKLAAEITDKYLDATSDQISAISQTAAKSLPTVFIAGLAAGGDLTAPARGAIESAGVSFKSVTEWSKVISFSVIQALDYANETQKRFIEFDQIAQEQWAQELRDATSQIRDKVYGMNNNMMAINAALQQLDDAQRSYRSLLAEGERIQTEREVFRQRAAAVVQGYRTRDAAFRIFRNEKLDRYKTMFDLAAQYAFMAAQAFDYDTGLLHTPEGREFINRIVRSRALGVMADGEPQFAGSDTGDPGLSSAMAEMKSEWLVLKGRLGFKNPDAHGTTFSLRSENYRILPDAEGATAWSDVLHAARKSNLLEDPDVRRYCMQIDPGNGLPVPGLVLEFTTTIADGLNFFGRPLAPGDHSFSAASFATKIHGVGVALEGYRGMDDPSANGSAVNASGASSPADPSRTFLDPEAMSATPYIYLIPVGVDSMRSPPLGDASVVRNWNVEDVAIPLPFNIGGSPASTAPLWQTSQSLTEPIFAIRKHPPFRPVSSADIFGTLDIYWGGGEFDRTQFASTRLLGRSAWNSRWKIVIPGKTLLNNPHDGLDRFIRSVSDVKLYFITYSYAGN